MTPDFATILAERKAQWIAQDGRELSTLTEVKRWWPDVHVDSRFAAVNYLNAKTSVLNDAEVEKLFVSSPTVGGEILAGNWRLVYAGIEEGRSGVVQVLRKGFVQTVQTQYIFEATGGTSPALDLNFVDSGETLNGEAVCVDSTGVYAKWFDGAQWVISLVADVGAVVGDPLEIVVTIEGIEQVVPFVGMSDERPAYAGTFGPEELNAQVSCLYDGTQQVLEVSDSYVGTLYRFHHLTPVYNPPLTGWLTEAGDPAENLTVEYDPVDAFVCATEEGNYSGFGAWTGTVTVAAMTPPQFNFSEFLNESGPLWHSGASQTTLRLPNVDPAYVEAIKAELQSADSFSDLGLKHETLTGTHYFIRVESRPEEDGSYSVFLFLAKHNNSDLYFHFRADANTIRGIFIKRDATDATLSALMETLRFNDTTGALWVSGSTTGFSTLQADVAGRTVSVRRTDRDETDRLYDLDVEIVWSTGSVFAGATAVTVDNGRIATVTEQGWRATAAQLEAKRTEYAALLTGQTGKLDFRDRGDGLFDYAGVIVTTGAASDYIQMADQTAYYGFHIDPAGSEALCAHAAGPYDWAGFKSALGTAMGNARITWNDDGTLDYVVITTGDLADSDWTSCRGTQITERVIVLRNKTDAEIDTALNTTYAAALAPAAGRQVAIERVKDDAERLSVTIRITTASAVTDVLADYGTYQVKTSVTVYRGAAALPTAGTLDPTYAADGLSRIDYELTGPGGGGLPVLNADGSYDYAVVRRAVTVKDDYWHLFALDFDTERNQVRQSVSYQQIRRRIGGDLAYNKDDAGNLVGVRWNNAFSTDHDGYSDTAEPAAWETLGYRRRYGDWKTAAWRKTYYQNYANRNIEENPKDTRSVSVGSALTGYTDDPLYIGTNGAVFIAAVPASSLSVTKVAPGDVWFAFDQNKFYGIGSVIDAPDCQGNPSVIGIAYRCTLAGVNFGKIYICKLVGVSDVALTHTTYWTEVNAGTTHFLSDLRAVDPEDVETVWPGMPGRLAVRGQGNYPIEEPDLYIPILQELEREVRWDNDFDADRDYGDTAAPAAWAAKGYDLIYGEWISGWEKTFIQNYLVRNPAQSIVTYSRNPLYGSNYAGHTDDPIYIAAGGTFIASVAASSAEIYYGKTGDVWFAQDTGNFYKAKSSWTATAKYALSNTTYFDVVTKANVDTTCPGLPGYIGLAGVGSYPIEERAQVGVINGEGGYALSSSARVSFYTSPVENPRMLEIFEATRRRTATMTLYTYFAVNPHWLAEASRDIPTAWADVAAVKALAAKATEDVLTNDNPNHDSGLFAYNAGSSNFGIAHRLVQLDRDVWAFEKKIVLRGEWEADAEALSAICAMAASGAATGIQNSKALVYTDLSTAVSPPWAGTFKDAG